MQNGAIIDSKRRVEIWGKIIRQVVALLYLVAELQLGKVPEEIKVGNERKSN